MKKFFLIFITLFFSATIFAEDGVEINTPKEFLWSKAVQNWKSGQTDSRLELNMHKAGLKLPADKNESFQLIDRYAPYLLKDIYLSIMVDSSHRLGDYLAEGAVSLNEINNIIDNGQRTDPRFSKDLDKAIIFHSAHLQDIAKLFIKHKTPSEPTIPPSTVVSKEYTGILIDARGSQPVHGEYIKEQVQPALFPKIWDANMSLIFEKNMVDPDIARSKGIVRYSDTLNEVDYRDVIGTNPLRILARGVFGQNRTDPIISVKDSSKILARTENLKLLEKGRIVIICDNLQISPPYPQPDENFYFDYRGTDLVLEGTDAIILTPEPNNDILKITMYDIHFVADQPYILPQDMGRIDVIAEALRRLGPNVRFIIEGHTAELNRPDDQLLLSMERAKEMANQLSKRGIDASRIATDGFGATKPIAPSDTETNKAKNRRVEIKIIRQ